MRRHRSEPRSPCYSPCSDLHTDFGDLQLNLNLLEKHFQANELDAAHARRREEFQARREQLQKRREAYHARELLLKERILRFVHVYVSARAWFSSRSYETYIKVGQCVFAADGMEFCQGASHETRPIVETHPRREKSHRE